MSGTRYPALSPLSSPLSTSNTRSPRRMRPLQTPGPAGRIGPARRLLRGEEAGGRAHLEDGTRVSCETARRVCCDSSIVTVLQGGDGPVLDIGRQTRKIPPALRRALEIRDGGCRGAGAAHRRQPQAGDPAGRERAGVRSPVGSKGPGRWMDPGVGGAGSMTGWMTGRVWTARSRPWSRPAPDVCSGFFRAGGGLGEPEPPTEFMIARGFR